MRWPGRQPTRTHLPLPALQAGTAAAAAQVAQACSDPSSTVAHPVLFLLRSDATSVYHHWEDGVHLLLSLAAAPELQAAVIRQGLQVRAGCRLEGAAPGGGRSLQAEGEGRGGGGSGAGRRRAELTQGR
jgi:hypothetical protein